ncbi:MAG: RHS repeat-associated core domain-containing protein [Armatimonadetes bacterium]|nr:RHS repeat-associated core domain-containing protein [Armatimonadota bacterium]
MFGYSASLGVPNGGHSDPFGYNAQWGYYLDREHSYYLCGHRSYDHDGGRWLTRDPIGFAGGVNLYSYCGQGPVADGDPLGLEDWGKFWRGMGQGFGEQAGAALLSKLTDLYGINGAADSAIAFVSDPRGTIECACRSISFWATNDEYEKGRRGANIISLAAKLSVARGLGAGVASEEIVVSRWPGQSGLQPGNRVMKGRANWPNYVLSGKWQPEGMIGGNKPAPFNTGAEFTVPRNCVKLPGWNSVVDNPILKGILGQRIYVGPPIN